MNLALALAVDLMIASTLRGSSDINTAHSTTQEDSGHPQENLQAGATPGLKILLRMSKN